MIVRVISCDKSSFILSGAPVEQNVLEKYQVEEEAAAIAYTLLSSVPSAVVRQLIQNLESAVATEKTSTQRMELIMSYEKHAKNREIQ